MIETIIDIVMGHPVIATSALAGYALAIIAPVPFLSRLILDGWAKFGGKIKNLYQTIKNKITGVKTEVATEIETSVNSK